jgi:pimeloyl-[acyl-carrier protein] methyl ester esterase
VTAPCLALVHGWGSDAEVWKPLLKELSGLDAVTFDLGFFGRPRLPSLARRADVIAVGHSLGFLWLLHERPFAWRALVSICGFPRFTRGPDFPLGVAPRVLERMAAKLPKDPASVVAEFRRRCGCPLPPRTRRVDAARLGEGLSWLARWDERAALDAERTPVLALFARDDDVVPPALSSQVFEDREGVTAASAASGGHALPLTRPAWCATQMRKFLEALS